MLKNHLKIALRQLKKQKFYSGINILGLAIGMTCCLIIALFIRDDLMYDRFHENADQTYRALWHARFGDNEWKVPLVPVPLGRTLKSDFPEVKYMTQFVSGGWTLRKGEEYLREPNIFFVDNDFFNVFSVSFLFGSPVDLTSKNDIILTSEMAQRYFDHSNPIGKTIERNDGQQLLVKGVVGKLPTQSHFHFDFIAPLSNVENVENRKDHWGSATVFTYFTLEDGVKENILQQKLQKFVNAEIAGENFNKGNNFTSFPFQKLTDIHLSPKLEEDIAKGGSKTYVFFLGLIACIILVLACINFINIATARAVVRAKEVGIRKVLGSQRWQLIRQFISESTLYVFLAIGVALILCFLTLPLFNAFTEKELALDFLGSPLLWGLITGITLFAAILVGLFPSFVLSSFAPVKVLKGKLAQAGKTNWLRHGLVILQFCVSIGLIICTLVIWGQLDFLRKQNLGFDKENVLLINRATALNDQYDVFLKKLEDLPVVQQYASSQFLPGDDFSSTVFLPEQPANFEETSLTFNFIDGAFSKTLKLNFTEGRDINPAIAGDSLACLINQTAAKRLGWENPVGKTMNYGGRMPFKVVGVVEDFNFESMHHDVEPIVMMKSWWNLPSIAIRLERGDIESQIASIQSTWKEVAPLAPFNFSFLDDDYQHLYQSEMKMSKVFSMFSLLAIFISCLGLFGLATFMAVQRTKEIGIRKVLGASVTGIVGLLSKDFIKPVLVAFIIASPLAWYGMEKWLENFAYRLEIQWWMVVVSGLAAITIACITISFQSIKTALLNPVESLRSE